MIITGEKNIARVRMVTQRAAIRLEMLGMKHSRGSVYAQVKKEYGLKGSRRSIIGQLSEMLATDESA